jgi:hypothetical protein
MITFAANNDLFRKRKRVYRACENCKKRRVRLQIRRFRLKFTNWNRSDAHTRLMGKKQSQRRPQMLIPHQWTTHLIRTTMLPALPQAEVGDEIQMPLVGLPALLSSMARQGRRRSFLTKHPERLRCLTNAVTGCQEIPSAGRLHALKMSTRQRTAHWSII